MKKGVLIGAIFAFFIVILLIAGVMAANNTAVNNTSSSSSSSSNSGTSTSGTGITDTSGDAVDKGYQCLDSQTKDKAVSALSLQDAVFSTLALGNKKNLVDKIDSEKKQGESCWPKAGCTLKETAQVALAYDRIGKNAEDIKSWLIGKNASSADLTWYIEVDIEKHEPAECTLRYDGNDRKINILSDMRIEGNPGNCFSISTSGYWLNARESCFDKEIQISCNQDFITALLYEKKAGSGTVYVSSTSHSAAALGSTTEKIEAKCFKSGNACDYEGSLWSALALHKMGVDVSAFIPYLFALADNNQRYFPSAFLYSILGGEDQYSQIIQQQKQGRSWKIIGSPYNEFYDTSMAMLALGSSSSGSAELENTKNYLLSIQGKEGCWNNNNIRDTGFVLYSGWSKSVSGVGGTGASALCTGIAGQSCEIANECIDAGGRVLSNFQCSGISSCCSIEVKKAICQEQKGIICSSSQRCEGRVAQASETGVCCLDACIEVEQQSTCEIFGGRCTDSCGSSEEVDKTNTCPSSGQMCCIIKTSTSGNAWIWILILLVILVALAIVFRNKLRVWWFTFKGKAKVTPVTRPGSPGPGRGMSFGLDPERFKPRAPGPAVYRPQPRPIGRAPPANRNSGKDKEMEETLRKLREISK